MICPHPGCTGNHNDRQFETLCPRSKENKLATARLKYSQQSWREHYAKQLKTRRLKALQRMERRQRGAVQEQG